MGHIYRNAILTIAASASKNSDISFLAPKPRPRPPTLEVGFTDQNHKAYSFNALRLLNDHAHDESEAGPLQERAWAYQEYLLLRRIISYENNKITLRCCSESRCQCRQRSYAVQYISRVMVKPDVSSGDQLLETWFGIVIRYSEQTLTFSTDRLAALLGIASSIQKATGWTYVAGVWRERILACLCWSRVDAPSSMHSNVAPTFSWASVSGQSLYDNPLTPNPRRQNTIHATFSRLDFENTGSNRFNRVASDTFVELVAPVWEVRMYAHCYARDTPTYWAEYDDCLWHFFPDCPLGAVSLGDKVVAARRSEIGSPGPLNELPIWILFLATSKRRHARTESVVSRKLQANSDGFERIGNMTRNPNKIMDTSGQRQANEIRSAWLQAAMRSRIRVY